MEIAIIISVIGAATIFAALIINHRFKQAHFEIWVADFEQIYGEKVSEEDKDLILRDIFTDGVISIRQAIILYKEAKNA